MDEESLASNAPGDRVSLFDYSVENYFKTTDAISELCEEADGVDESEIQRFSSSITFLREWKYFNYEPRTIRFANDTGTCGEKVVLSEINLPQFSSATVPKRKEGLSADTNSLESGKDFVMYAGGSVWALDWCPRVHARPDCHTKCEFIAVAAHPPESYYHKLGAPLTGRGIIQIWCILNASVNEEEPAPTKKNAKKRSSKAEDAIEDKLKNNSYAKNNSSQLKRPRGRPRKKPRDESSENLDVTDQFVQALAVQNPDDSSELQFIQEVQQNIQEHTVQLKRPRGRPRKKPRDESSDNFDVTNQFDQALAVQNPDDSSELHFIQEVHQNIQEHTVQKNLGKKPKNSKERASSSHSALKIPVNSRRFRSKASAERCNDDICQQLLTLNEDEEAPIASNQIYHSSRQDSVVCDNVSGKGSLDISLASCSIPKDTALPRVILCLAHNGKVAWDVKWQPYNVKGSKCQQRMGYLAVVLGNGSVEVWEVPLPHVVKAIYLSSFKEGTDPRFVKLEPVFRCSMLKCGGIQSIPLTVEWSTSHPHDYLLAGCHDGTVALWKFSACGSSKDTRPLLCFSADTVPIRAVAWAPTESDLESGNVIVTAGHGGLKFWDIRDPFRPLWDLHPVPRFIYDLDWSRDPCCVILSYDDGGLRILSLVKTAYDVPATGKPFVGTKHGLHLCNFSPFALWGVQVSRQTGMVAYCSADGTVLRFQLTTKAIEKDFSRNRAPHFLCGSLTEDESAVTVHTPLPDTPITLKKPSSDSGERSMRSLATDMNSVKSANDKKKKTGLSSDNQTLAICYGNDSGEDSEADVTLAALKSQKESKSRNNNRKKAKDDQALVCIDEAVQNIPENETEKGETGNDLEVFPSKLVAIHRVRWNMNKGSERWLCYGGAAGIIRCQEIIEPQSNVDKKGGCKKT